MALSPSAANSVLIAGDADAFMRLFNAALPHLPRFNTPAEAEAALHMARTAARTVPLGSRLYSHKWLTERGYRSLLPNDLLPKPEMVEPVIIASVGICVKSADPEVTGAIRGVMENSVLEDYADGRTDPAYVKGRMLEARKRERKALGLRVLA